MINPKCGHKMKLNHNINRGSSTYYCNLGECAQWKIEYPMTEAHLTPNNKGASQMLSYLTPSTLKEMYKDLDESRLELFELAESGNSVACAQYSEMVEFLQAIDEEYENNTGDLLWTQDLTESASN